MEDRCLSYSRGIAYHPIIDVLKSNFNIADDDDHRKIKTKVKNGLKVIKADDPVTRGYLLELFSIKDAQIQDIINSQEEKKYRLIEALKKIVIKGSETRPLVLAAEDLHWIDQSSEDAFKSLLRSISGSRVFLIFTYRPEYVHTWGTRTYHSQLNLNRFSNRESLLMVNHLLGTTVVEETLEELILEKAEGVPFLIEEFIRSLKDLAIIEKKNNRYRLVKTVHEITIPNTIQDVIMARVDSLPESARSVLVTGSAIEREFSHNLLKNVIGVSEKELLTCLSVLKDAELLIEKLASILNDKKMLARIYIALGTYYYSIEENIEKGLKYFKDASNLFSISKDFLSAYYAFLYIGCHFKWSCDFSKAQLNFKKCMELSSAANNPIGMSSPKALSCYAYCYRGKINKALYLAEEGLETAEQSGYLFNKAPAYTSYGISSYYRGAFNEAEKYLLLGTDYSKKISQIGWEHWACFNLGNLYLDIGNLNQAREYLNRSLSIIQHFKLLPSWKFNCHVAIKKLMVLGSDMNFNLHEIFVFYDKNKFNVNRGYIARNISEILLLLGKKTLSDAKSWVNKAIEND